MGKKYVDYKIIEPEDFSKKKIRMCRHGNFEERVCNIVDRKYGKWWSYTINHIYRTIELEIKKPDGIY